MNYQIKIKNHPAYVSFYLIQNLNFYVFFPETS
jgi:hypothetical protein